MIRLADDTQRTFITGATGSGKTVAGLYHLSHSDFASYPWLIYDFKRDAHLAALPAIEIELDEIPDGPGLYIVRPLPASDDEAVEAQMWAIWEQGETGVWIDEGFMVSRGNRAYQALLTQGRSKSIPVITLTQKPKFLPSSFVISESDFFQIYHLNDWRDIERIQDFVTGDISQELPQFYSYYYDVGRRKLTTLRPVPAAEISIARITAQLRAMAIEQERGSMLAAPSAPRFTFI